MWRQFPLFAIGLMFTATGVAQDPVQTEPDVIRAGGIEFTFASPNQGRQLLRQRDRFIDQMSPFDRQVRMRTSDDQGIDAFLEFAAGEVLAWPPQKRKLVRAAIESLDGPLRKFKLPDIDPVVLVHTSGREESRAAYTRGPAIVLPPNMIASGDAKNRKLLAHELFHVISRANPELRDRLYSILGFRRTGKISLPDNAPQFRLTNPDAPVVEHVIRVKLSEEESVFVAPMVYSDSPLDPTQPRSLFAFLNFQLMEVIPIVGKRFIPVSNQGQPVFHDPSLPDFQRQIGGNTKYILHPEEIMAVNFSLLVTGAKVKDPWVIDRMRETFAGPDND
jgi:hypothetical protein